MVLKRGEPGDRGWSDATGPALCASAPPEHRGTDRFPERTRPHCAIRRVSPARTATRARSVPADRTRAAPAGGIACGGAEPRRSGHAPSLLRTPGHADDRALRPRISMRWIGCSPTVAATANSSFSSSGEHAERRLRTCRGPGHSDSDGMHITRIWIHAGHRAALRHLIIPKANCST